MSMMSINPEDYGFTRRCDVHRPSADPSVLRPGDKVAGLDGRVGTLLDVIVRADEPGGIEYTLTYDDDQYSYVHVLTDEEITVHAIREA